MHHTTNQNSHMQGCSKNRLVLHLILILTKGNHSSIFGKVLAYIFWLDEENGTRILASTSHAGDTHIRSTLLQRCSLTKYSCQKYLEGSSREKNKKEGVSPVAAWLLLPPLQPPTDEFGLTSPVPPRPSPPPPSLVPLSTASLVIKGNLD